MNRKKIAAGNWKMNFLPNDVNQFITEFAPNTTNAEVMIGAPFIYLERLLTLKSKGVQVLSQDVSVHEKGAYTGEVSAEMLSALGVNGAIVGHSERRTYHTETDSLIAKKVDACLRAGIIPVYCCGELLAEREAGRQEEIVGRQVREALSHLTKEQILKVVIAYEPVWAIGTGVTASNEQAEEMHVFVRSVLAEIWGSETAQQIRILYGGSVSAANADGLFACPNVDGGLVGGASLKVNDFTSICQSANA
jgi:triosephosphate isomerase